MSCNNPTGNEKIKFSDKENQFLLNNEICRVATLSKNSIPHVVPVPYAFADELFFFVTGYNTIKYRNLRENKNVSLVVDIYDPPNHKAVVIRGFADIIEGVEDFRRLQNI